MFVKTKLLSVSVIACLGIGIISALLGMLAYFAYSKAVEEYPTSPLARPGSSLPYPAYEWLYLEISGIFFVTSVVLFIIWRKRK